MTEQPLTNVDLYKALAISIRFSPPNAQIFDQFGRFIGELNIHSVFDDQENITAEEIIDAAVEWGVLTNLAKDLRTIHVLYRVIQDQNIKDQIVKYITNVSH